MKLEKLMQNAVQAYYLNSEMNEALSLARRAVLAAREGDHVLAQLCLGDASEIEWELNGGGVIMEMDLALEDRFPFN